MLSIGKLTPERSGYYEQQVQAGKDEYYTSGREEPGRWAGGAAKVLGLEGEVGALGFRRALEAKDPLSGDDLGVPRTSAKRLAGLDLCFSAPKSVSVAWALAPPGLAEKVAAAHDNAVAQALGALEAECLRLRRGAGGREVIRAEGFLGAAFAHRTSRAGDPQVHTHVVVANLGPDGQGRWSALHASPIYHWAKTLGYLYQSALRDELSGLGFSFGPVGKGAAEIEGVPKEALAAFSGRRASIESSLGASGHSSKKAAEVAALSTRGPKRSVASLGHLRREWQDRAEALGLSRGFVEGLTGHVRAPAPDQRVLHELMLSADGLTANASAFDRRAVLQCLAGSHRDGAPVAALRASADSLSRHPEVVALAAGPHGDRRWSTNELLQVEAGLLERALRRPDVAGPVPATALREAVAARPTLSDEQRRMVAALTASGAGVQVVVGRAGAGKTYALDAARAAWEASGRRVVGTALAARAAAELEAGAGIPSATLDRLLGDLGRPGPLPGLAPGTVVVVDEAGMVGTRKLARLLAYAEQSAAQVVLVGDPRQLPEVEAGGAFPALAKALPVVELRENRRQAEAWERDALAELRSGSPRLALTAYQGSGRLHLAPSAEAAREAMTEAWWASYSSGEDAMMYALRRSDVDDLNARARLRMRAAGLVGEETLEVAGKSFAVGDRVVTLRNDHRLGVRNGTLGEVASLEPLFGALVLGDGTYLPAGYLRGGHLAHAYATTVHKAQGATVDRAFLLGSDRLYREAGYVGMSRGRLANDLFAVSGDDGHDVVGELSGQLQKSRAQSLALGQLAGAASPEELLLSRPGWAVQALGEPPLDRRERARWAGRAARLAAHRAEAGVQGPGDAMGPPPTDAHQRRAWEAARSLAEGQGRDLGAERGLSL